MTVTDMTEVSAVVRWVAVSPDSEMVAEMAVWGWDVAPVVVADTD
ncbi:hypothetical protein [Acetobacter musti]|nr:hypothetical protein [Acetobacter musti]